MGVIYSDQGNYNTAREYFEEGLVLAQEVHDRLQASLFLRNLGDIALSTGDFDNALSFFEKFRRLIQDTPDDFYLNMVFFDIGEVARFQGNYDKAIVSFEKGLAGAKSEYWKATFYLGLANIEQMRNHSINAKQHLLMP
ncbi:tetratricopeptide repeat protein [Candidatus Villigracilis affinis]|uniref:tetratricopeptide repeat protein n=1 Tax=Candidatus Villigracilis affinis TaxID=3140682 RepID=UPI002A1BC2C5|nr:tetratricopeptide repeat protein [Anaerolineales bacterium]